MRKHSRQSNRPSSSRRAPVFGAIVLPLLLAACAPSDRHQVDAIEITAHGIMEYGDAIVEKDQSSVIGSEIRRARAVRITTTTDRIPLRIGTSFGISFVVRGAAELKAVPVTIILRSSIPCVLRATGKIVHQNDTVMEARVGVARFIGGRIVAEQDNPCVGPQRPRTETFEIYYLGKKYAEQRFWIVSDGNA